MENVKKTGQYILSRLTFKRIIILILLFVFVVPLLFPSSGENEKQYEYTYIKGDKSSLNKILAVPVQGVILTESATVPNPLDFLQGSGVTYGYSVKDSLERAANDPTIKGILLQVNSPGGTIPGSKAISDGILAYKEKTGNPVYVHIREVGASGAYWASVVGDKVIADTGSLTGSIGVIMGPFKYYNGVVEEGSILGGVTTENGIENTIFSAGKYKDTGSPYRPLTAEERTHWQTSLDNEYAIFVDHVSKYRSIDKDTIINDIKALPYENKRALEFGLIDETGSEEDALSELLDETSISPSDYQMIYEQEKVDVINQLFSAVLPAPSPRVENPCVLCGTPLFLFDSTYKYFK